MLWYDYTALDPRTVAYVSDGGCFRPLVFLKLSGMQAIGILKKLNTCLRAGLFPHLKAFFLTKQPAALSDELGALLGFLAHPKCRWQYLHLPRIALDQVAIRHHFL